MRTKLLLLLAPSVLALGVGAQPSAPKNFDGKTWWDHVKVLADDSMEGRETGSTGLRKAEAYVVEQLKKDGLQPAGTRGFYQSVKFVSRQIVVILLRDFQPISDKDQWRLHFGREVNTRVEERVFPERERLVNAIAD